MTSITGLSDLLNRLRDEDEQKLPPVHLWNPPLCKNIEMRIDERGQWYFNNSPINRRRMIKLFSTVLRRDGNDYFLVTPIEKIKVKVDKKPFIVIDFEVKKEQGFTKIFFLTNTDTVICLNQKNKLTVEVDKKTKEPFPYIVVRNNLEALISRSVFYKLVDLSLEREGELFIESNQTLFSLGKT